MTAVVEPTAKTLPSPSTSASNTPARVQIATPALHHIVVVEGGATGLELATKLGDRFGRRKKAQITLVERARTHIWKPLLHEVAAGSLDPGRDAVDYLAQAADRHFRSRIGEMIGLNRAQHEVHLAASVDAEGNEVTPPRSLAYDTLIITVGSTSNDFGTPGAKDFAISLDTAEQAVRFNQRLVNRFIRAHAQPGPVRPGQLHVTIIGKESQDHAGSRWITLVEAAERILPAVPPRVSEGAANLLRKLGIDVRTQARVVEVQPEGGPACRWRLHPLRARGLGSGRKGARGFARSRRP